MSQSAVQAAFDTPLYYDIGIGTGVPSGVVNVGDWLAYSGTSIVATNAGHTAYWKASGVGVALESNPVYDQHGRTAANTGMRFVRQGLLRVSAAFSGQVTLGLGVYPAATGSGLAAPTGGTGVGATWQTGVRLAISGGTGAGGSGVAMVVGTDLTRAVAGTGQMDVLLLPPRPDFY